VSADCFRLRLNHRHVGAGNLVNGFRLNKRGDLDLDPNTLPPTDVNNIHSQ